MPSSFAHPQPLPAPSPEFGLGETTAAHEMIESQMCHLPAYPEFWIGETTATFSTIQSHKYFPVASNTSRSQFVFETCLRSLHLKKMPLHSMLPESKEIWIK